MHGDSRVFVVIEARAAQLAVVHAEAEGFDEMQSGPRIRRQADHVAGVRRDFGVDEDDGEHGASGVRVSIAAQREVVWATPQ